MLVTYVAVKGMFPRREQCHSSKGGKGSTSAVYDAKRRAQGGPMSTHGHIET